jgi:hypothetical protein
MPGMNSGIKDNGPTLAAAFEATLRHQAIVVLLTFAVLGLAWLGVQAWLARAGADGAAEQAPGSRPPGSRAAGSRAAGSRGTGSRAAGSGFAAAAEPPARRLIRIGFGLLWLFDGVLQAQPKMAAGLPSQIIEPVAASSPHWVHQLVNWSGTAWSDHPVPAATAAVWIQVGIGTWMLVASRGPWSRLGGLASFGWGLAVWVFGESFGGIFVPGLSWLTGAPGAALSYAVAGALVALPERAWQTVRLGRLTLTGLGLFLAGMAVLQAWPGRGFWPGTFHGQPGALTGMVQSMATIPQPHFLSAWVAGFGSFNAAHGFAVNLAVVVVLALSGAMFLSGRPRLIRPALIAVSVLCLADWVLVEDLGFFGGLGTDPNSMPPFALLAVAGYLALASGPMAAGERAGTGTPAGWPAGRRDLTDRRKPSCRGSG